MPLFKKRQKNCLQENITVRISICLSLCALSALLSVSSLSVRADDKAPDAKTQNAVAEPLVIVAQGHPKHVDFVAKSSKRADLRANIQRKGLNVAFTEWLRAEHAHIYRQHVEQSARANQSSDGKKVAAR